MRPFTESSSSPPGPSTSSSDPADPMTLAGVAGATEPDKHEHEPDQWVPDEMYRYDLFSVVTHEGKLDNGHYWADVLSSGEWWHCDDDKGKSTSPHPFTELRDTYLC